MASPPSHNTLSPDWLSDMEGRVWTGITCSISKGEFKKGHLCLPAAVHRTVPSMRLITVGVISDGALTRLPGSTISGFGESEGSRRGELGAR